MSLLEKASKVNSLALFVGTGECNAHCEHCAGVPHRKYAPKQDGMIDEDLIYKALKECYAKGARRLSLSSSGEPTLSPAAVTKTLELVNKCKQEDIYYSPIHIYSNGIRIGENKGFCLEYLWLWRSLGLTSAYITVHDIDNKENARVYGVEHYPPLELVISRIHDAGLFMRANLVLSKESIGTYQKFVSTVENLIMMGVDKISAWPIRDMNDNLDSKLSPPESELDKMSNWVINHWGIAHRITLLRENSRVRYEIGSKLTLFPDGTLSNTWCNH